MDLAGQAAVELAKIAVKEAITRLADARGSVQRFDRWRDHTAQALTNAGCHSLAEQISQMLVFPDSDAAVIFHGGGVYVPPLARVANACSTLLADALEDLERRPETILVAPRRTANPSAHGDKVFIGHGRSTVWHQLRDLLRDRCGLSFDEYDRTSTAGVGRQERLAQMLHEAVFAFVVMTGEDQTAHGELRARENVVHEAGLFQGKLGFKRAILLLEDGCNQFSNVEGLGHIPFPRGNLTSASEKIREVLERENVLPPPRPGRP